MTTSKYNEIYQKSQQISSILQTLMCHRSYRGGKL